MENIETLLAAVAQTQGFDDDEPDAPTGLDVGSRDSESSPVIQGESGDFRSSSVFSADAQQSMVMAMPPPAPVPASRAAGPLTGDREKRKRGRPPKGQLPSIPPPPKRTKVEDEEEDVCFICFDGGSLVLCDRKGCPKAYHPACVKRDEAFFRSKAKWNCGWHICSVCRKASHYICYTCTYSLCKGCTKDTDYLSVRGNKGFCSTCMKTIMLIEDKDHANSDSVQVDFDDKTSWEYLFKVYWVCLKEKLSLNLTELRQATKPWKPVAALASRGQSRNLRNRSVDGRVSISLGTGEHSEFSEPHLQTSLLQNDEGSRLAQSSNDNHVEIVNISNGDGPTSDNGTLISTHLVLNKPHLETSSPQNGEVRTEESSISDLGEKLDSSGVEGEACHNKGIGKLNMDEPIQELGIDMQGIENDQDNLGNDKNAEKPCISNDRSSEELPEQQNCKGGEWASKDLLDFVAHMRNGDISAMSPFDVQTLLLNYIKRNHLRDPRRKSQIVCDSKLKTLFGKPRVGHIEMLKLLEYHFLIKDDSLKNSFIPAGFVSSGADDMEVDDHNNESSIPVNSRKRKMRRKSEDAATQNNLSDYAAIDIQNINLIYLRRNLMENLIEDHESFNDKVIGAIVRIKIASNDQKQNVHRLVQVVGTSKVSEPYKVGDRTVDIMLEVLNLDKKELVSIEALSNQEFTEDECRRLRQSIRCGLVKQFTVGEIQKKAMSLQAVRVSDWLKVEIQRLSHLRDRASENGRKKELREHVSRLQLLNSPEERLRRISEVPNVNADAKMDPNYLSEEDVKSDDNCRTDEFKVQNSSGFLRNGRKLISPSKEKQPVHEQNSAAETVGVSASLRLDSYLNRATVSNPTSCTVTDQFMQDSGEEASAVRNSGSSDHIETERLWHYRDPNGKIQGPFAMMQLRKWSTTGLFPPEMRIWTNHEQYDSLLLVDALNGQFHGASEMSRKPPSESEENGVRNTDAIRNGGEFRRIEATSSNNTSILPEKAIGPVEAKELSSSWPQCRDLLKDSCASDVQARNVQSDPRLDCDELNHGSQIGDKIPAQVSQNLGAGGSELQKPSDNEDRAGPSTEKALRSLNIDLFSDDMESVPVPVVAPISTTAEPSKQVGNTFVFDLPSPTPSENHQSSVPLVSSAQKTCILELLSPAPRSNSEDQGGQGTETKQAGILDFPVTSLCPSWSIDVNSVLDDVEMPGVAGEWCGYSPTPVKPSSLHEWDPSLISPSSLKPPGVGVAVENLGTSSTSSNIQMTHAPNIPNWLTTLSETIEFDALGEESVSDLLAEVDAMESQGTLPSPTSALKFARELLEDCKDDCFSSIEEFSSAHGPIKSDALSSSSEIHFTSHSCSGHLGPSPVDAFDFFSKSSVHSSAASSEGENKAPVYSGDAGSEFHPSASNNTNHEMMGATTMAPDSVDPGWGNVQGNINLVTVQGNVNLVLGGPAQGMANLNWGANQGTPWVNTSHGPGSLPWDGQRKYNGERFSSPREWAYQGNDSGFGRSRPPWSRQPYSGGGYTRPPKGQRVCKFYESGHCKKGAFCDYLHP